jgi:hypothetical protein
VNNSERTERVNTQHCSGLRDLARLIGFALLLAAVIRELRLPKRQRTWHGLLFGRVPYELRPPTFARVKSTLWNPRNSQVLVPTALGVGWSVNLAALRNRLTGAAA